ncbi:MAG: NADH:flavin oxidoreductase, partial [Eubacteriales bacterium]|nr:NADH:flavin oxidoreductase [Eubacteriales bacterium]
MNRIDIFHSSDIAGINFNNRILRAATDEGMAENGNPTERLINLYEKLARGGVGGIITGYMSVSQDGESVMPGMIMIESDERIPQLAEVVKRVHELHTPIIAQIAHCGRNGVAGKSFQVGKISESTIERVADDFVKAVIRAYKAGYDGVELHLAHGYFLSEMVSPHTNKRKDRWGGSTENRMRIVKLIMDKVRKELPDYPVFAKVNGDEIYKDGIHAEEVAHIAKLLEKYGVNAIEVSCGIDFKEMGPGKGKVPAEMILNSYPGMKELPGFVKIAAKPVISKMMRDTPIRTKYNVPSAKRIKDTVGIPVIAVGGIHDLP